MSDACGANQGYRTRVSVYAVDDGPELASGPEGTG